MPSAGKVGEADVTDPVMSALIQIESGGDSEAVSPAGAVGITQIMPETAANPGFGIDPIDLETSTDEEKVEFSRKYLDALKERYEGSLEYALAAYNWGVGNVDKWVKDGADVEKLPKETQNYLKRFREAGVLD